MIYLNKNRNFQKKTEILEIKKKIKKMDRYLIFRPKSIIKLRK